MPRDFATQFLNRKRKEQEQSQTNEMAMSLAPSPYERYGLMGDYPLASGKYTGNGPNGVSEPNMPTERRVSINGRPYVVDESEVLVNDAETVRAYGGPEELDRFIQQNRPDGQMADRMCAGGVPRRMMGGGNPMRYMDGGIPNARQMYPAGSIVPPQGVPPLSPGLERPYDRQFNILREVRYGQVPRMQIGGPIDLTGRTITTEDPATQATINPQTGGVEYTGELQGVTGPQPNAQPIPQMDYPTFTFPQQDIGKAEPIPEMDYPTFNVASVNVVEPPPIPQTIPGSPSTSIDMNTVEWKADDPNRPADTHIVRYDSIGRPIYGYGTPLETRTDIGETRYGITGATTPEGATTQIAPVPPQPIVPPQPPPQTGATLSPAQRDQMILDQYLTRQAGMGASERAGEAQRLMQQGVGEEAQRGMLAVSDVSRRSALGDTAARLGIDAATRAEARGKADREFAESKRRWDANFEQADREFAESKRRWDEQFGIQQSNQMITDAGSMTKESWLAKYPNMKPEDYDRASRMSDVVYETNAHTLTEMRNSYTGKQLYDYYQSHPDASWRTDDGAKQAMQVHYDTLGGEAALGPFDVWADTQESALRDPRVNSLIGQYDYELKSLVDAGILSVEEAADMKDLFVAFVSGKLQMKRIWTVGGEQFDSEQAAIDYANANGLPLTDVKSRWAAIDQTTGNVYDGSDNTEKSDSDATQISALTYGTLNGLSYGSGENTGQLANGETFSTDGAMSVSKLGYNLPKGTYTVETDKDGNIWYKAENGKYYLSQTDSVNETLINKSSDAQSMLAAGLDSADISLLGLEAAKDDLLKDYPQMENLDYDNIKSLVGQQVFLSEPYDSGGFLKQPGIYTIERKQWYDESAGKWRVVYNAVNEDGNAIWIHGWAFTSKADAEKK